MVYKNITNEEEFSKLIKENNKVVVDFWAPWCGPCRMFGPIFEEVSNELTDVTFLKVNVDEVVSIAEKFQIRSIPTTILFEDGEPKKKVSGAFDKSQFVDFINN